MYYMYIGEDKALRTNCFLKYFLILAIAGTAACTGCARSGQVTSEVGGSLQNAGGSLQNEEGSLQNENISFAVIPSEEAVRSFFASYGAEESVSETDGNRFVEYGVADEPSYCGSLNYDEDGTRLRNANFQIYGEVTPEDAEQFFTEAAALFFPEEDPEKALQTEEWDDSPAALIKEAVACTEEGERAWHASFGDFQLSIFTQPAGTAAPRYEMMIDIPTDRDQSR